MHALDVLGDPVRRRLLELLAEGETSAGDLGRRVQEEFGISQPAVSQHLRVLRESGFATVRPDGTRRLYGIDPAPLAEADAWFAAGVEGIAVGSAVYRPGSPAQDVAARAAELRRALAPDPQC